ncbi:hypothetical protein KW796_02810 [Candidatus Parcubacteria bacterium]|nr:hypothetical protein [Candidatus Parcubacteria bacterium]
MTDSATTSSAEISDSMLGPADEPSRLYICVGRSESLILYVRQYLEGHFHKVHSEWRKSGGRSGDLHEEIAHLDQYELSNGAGIQLYTLLDHSTNGYAECLSVLLPREHADGVKELVTFLTTLDFVTSHKNLRERPLGFKSYQAYLDDWYREGDQKPFCEPDQRT